MVEFKDFYGTGVEQGIIGLLSHVDCYTEVQLLSFVLAHGHKGRKKRSARSCGAVGRQLASVEKFCAWQKLEIRIEGVGIFKYQYSVQALYFNKSLKGTIQEALIPSPLVAP